MATDDLAGAPDKSPESVTRFTYNALGQTVTTVDPHVNVQRVAYNVAGLPDGTWFTAAGEVERVVMTGLAYDIHGQQIGGSCVNAANTPFITVALAYDPDTQQMTGIRTTRAKDGQDLQNLVYWYDPVGNVTHIENKAQGAVPSLPEGCRLIRITPTMRCTGLLSRPVLRCKASALPTPWAVFSIHFCIDSSCQLHAGLYLRQWR